MRTKEREELSRLLFELHEAAMDASTDPTVENMAVVRKLYQQMAQQKPRFFHEQAQNAIEAERERAKA